MASVIDEGISMQHRWNDDTLGQNRIMRTNPCLKSTYPPDIPHATLLFENREYVMADRRITAFGTARPRNVIPVIYHHHQQHRRRRLLSHPFSSW